MDTHLDLLDNQLRVLLVDDNKVNQFLGRKILNNLGIKSVELASSGTEAIDKLNGAEFDVLLTDVEMPGMSGYALCEWIRSREKEGEHLIVIALTANATREDREMAANSGIDDYLTKPYSPQDLYEVLHKHSGLLQNQLEDVSSPGAGGAHQPLQLVYESFRYNKADVRQFLHMLSQQMPELVNAIKDGILKGNVEQAYHNAHKLKSPVKLLGASEFVAKYAAFTESLHHLPADFNAASEFDFLLPGLESLLVIVNAELEKE